MLASLGILSRGGTLLMPSPRFDADLSIRAAAAVGATSLYAVPTMVIRMLASPLLAELRPLLRGRLRTGILAGSTVPVSLVRALGEELGLHGITIGCEVTAAAAPRLSCSAPAPRFLRRYGMTETSPLSFQTRPDDPEWARCETVGRVLPHTEAKVVDPATGRVVPRGTIGELATRGWGRKGLHCIAQHFPSERPPLFHLAATSSCAAATSATPRRPPSPCATGGCSRATSRRWTRRWARAGRGREERACARSPAAPSPQGYVAIVGRSKDMIIRGA